MGQENKTLEGTVSTSDPPLGEQELMNPFIAPEDEEQGTQFPAYNPDDDDDNVDKTEDLVPAAVVENEPNVRLSSKKEHLALAQGLVNIGMHPGIMIPDTQGQLAGFYVESPTVLINQFPQYKWVQKKGTPRPA